MRFEHSNLVSNADETLKDFRYVYAHHKSWMKNDYQYRYENECGCHHCTFLVDDTGKKCACAVDQEVYFPENPKEHFTFISLLEVLKEERGKGYGLHLIRLLNQNHKMPVILIGRNRKICEGYYKKIGFEYLKKNERMMIYKGANQ